MLFSGRLPPFLLRRLRAVLQLAIPAAVVADSCRSIVVTYQMLQERLQVSGACRGGTCCVAHRCVPPVVSKPPLPILTSTPPAHPAHSPFCRSGRRRTGRTPIARCGPCCRAWLSAAQPKTLTSGPPGCSLAAARQRAAAVPAMPPWRPHLQQWLPRLAPVQPPIYGS